MCRPHLSTHIHTRMYQWNVLTWGPVLVVVGMHNHTHLAQSSRAPIGISRWHAQALMTHSSLGTHSAAESSSSVQTLKTSGWRPPAAAPEGVAARPAAASGAVAAAAVAAVVDAPAAAAARAAAARPAAVAGRTAMAIAGSRGGGGGGGGGGDDGSSEKWSQKPSSH